MFGTLNDLIHYSLKYQQILQFKPIAQFLKTKTILRYIWDSEWSDTLFIKISTDTSSQAISTISENKDYIKVYPLTTDATPLNYNSFLPDSTGNNSLNSTVMQQENLNGTKNLTQHHQLQTSLYFANEEVVTAIVTTAQQSISPIHPRLTTPRPKNPILPHVTLQSTVKHTIEPRYPHVSYQPIRPMMKPIQKQRKITRNNFAEHNYNYVNRPQTSKFYRPNTQNHLFLQRQNFRQPTTTISVSSHDYPRNSQDQSENYSFFQQSKNDEQNQGKHNTPYYTHNHLSSDDDDYYQPDIFAPYTQEYRAKPPRPNQATQKTNFYSQNPAKTQNHKQLQLQNPTYTQSYQRIQRQNPVNTDYYQSTQMQNEIPLPYYLQQHEITKSQLTKFSQMPNAYESLQMTMNPYLMGGSSIQSNKPLMVFTGTDP